MRERHDMQNGKMDRTGQSRPSVRSGGYKMRTSHFALTLGLALVPLLPTDAFAAGEAERRPFGFYDDGSDVQKAEEPQAPPAAAPVVAQPSPTPAPYIAPEVRRTDSVPAPIVIRDGRTSPAREASPAAMRPEPVRRTPVRKASPAPVVPAAVTNDAIVESDNGIAPPPPGGADRPVAREDKSLEGVDPSATRPEAVQTIDSVIAAIPDPRDRALAQAMVERLMNAERLYIDNVIIDTRPLRAFYRERGFRPAWLRHGQPEAFGNPYIRAIRLAEDHGLNPAAYGLNAVMARAGDASVHLKAEQELLIAQGLLDLAQDLKLGRVKMSLWTSDYMSLPPQPFIPLTVLQTLAQHRDPISVMAELAPSGAEYRRLQQALLQYRTIAAFGDWPRVGPGETLRPGMRDSRVPDLRNRLMASGDLPWTAPVENSIPAAGTGTGKGQAPAAAPANPAGARPGELPSASTAPQEGISATSSARRPEETLYTADLEAAVRKFQTRNGLAVDGNVGNNTRAALNISVRDRIAALALNMDRLRAEPSRPLEMSILVNIPDYQMKVVDAQGRKELEMKVIVGRPSRQTNIFYSTIWGVDLNPYWNVPTTIARKDLLPKLKSSPDYLSSHGYTILAGWSADASEVNWDEVNWDAIGRSVRVRQSPGRGNALGKMKFRSNNPFAIYLHDTPSRGLFHKTRRAFSSGCIRLHHPQALANLLLTRNAGYTREEIQAKLDTGRNATLRLKHPVPMVMQYHTAWIEEDGTVQFREDLYGRDRDYRLAMGKALAER